MKIILSALILGWSLAGCSTAPKAVAPDGSAPAIKQASPALSDLIKKMEDAYRRGNDAQGLALAKESFTLEGTDLSAMDRVGTAYYGLARYTEALTVWTRALAFEHDNSRRKELAASVIAIQRALAAPLSAPASSAPVAVAAAAQAQALAQSAADFLAAGLDLQAADAALRARALDPGNASAARTLKALKLSL